MAGKAILSDLKPTTMKSSVLKETPLSPEEGKVVEQAREPVSRFKTDYKDYRDKYSMNSYEQTATT